jgi:hypothetical protein
MHKWQSGIILNPHTPILKSSRIGREAVFEDALTAIG